MKTIKITLFVALFAIATSCKAQDYGTLKYWGKDIKLDRSFFEILNSNYSSFVNATALLWKYYDARDYQNIYVLVVENLKSPKFTIAVTEANQLQWYNASIMMPGSLTETGRSKKSTQRAGWMLYQVVLPSLQQFARDK